MRFLKSLVGMCVFGAAGLGWTDSVSATVTPVTLSAFTIDSAYHGTIVDAASSVSFSNATANGGNGLFIIDYFNADSSLPLLTPGRILSTEGYVGNGGVSFPADFGFTMTLPTLASEVDMEMGYVADAGASITLDAYNGGGTLIGSKVFTPTLAFGSEIPVSFSTSSNLIKSISIVPNDIADNFGDISFTASTVPEPTSAIGVAVLGLAAVQRRRRVTGR